MGYAYPIVFSCYHPHMSKKAENNFAFIDGQNLHKAIKGLNWTLDYKRFRVYLKEKYHVNKCYMFMGFIPTNSDLYTALQNFGYILIFKPILTNKEGEVKGNCDADLVLHTMIEYPHYDQAVIVSGDGDFHSLVKYLREKKKLKTLLIPDQKRYSALLKPAAAEKIAFVQPHRKKLEYKKSTP
ncbi:MAG: hypothetical protein JWM56_424 [Candidatus Peribacteria bacterium]|nr:hypothetical protein [Candidatus Peribacteria bacterium]